MSTMQTVRTAVRIRNGATSKLAHGSMAFLIHPVDLIYFCWSNLQFLDMFGCGTRTLVLAGCAIEIIATADIILFGATSCGTTGRTIAGLTGHKGQGQKQNYKLHFLLQIEIEVDTLKSLSLVWALLSSYEIYTREISYPGVLDQTTNLRGIKNLKT
jgi:hypothetical protein